ncbi:MAG: YceI family protein [Saprospiraceae bacterium]|nr:YceI family protein [Saprospiraceae bacterium]
MYKILVVLLLLPTCIFAQDKTVYDIPLPEELANLKQEGIQIYSTPHPNHPEFEDKDQESIVWKHSTIIKVDENITITETGAYLLNNGTWWKRESFNAKQSKEMFATKKLKLAAGDSLIYKKNWRYGQYTTSGWNFWYVKGINSKKEMVFAYHILETTGKMADGTEVLPLKMEGSELNWTGKASGESTYSLSGDIAKFSGRLVIKNGTPISTKIKVNVETMNHQDANLISHLKNKDFFDVNKHPLITFKSTEITATETEKEYRVKGQLCIIGNCQEETWTISMNDEEETYKVDFDIAVDRTRYGMNYKSSKSEEQSIADEIMCKGVFSFQKDYPGSMRWNSVEQ